MINYAVDPALLAPLVPAGTVLDAHDGTTWLTLVGFRFVDTRVLGVRVPLHHGFEELNLRFYVRREERGETRRAVVFVREVVPRRAIALIARFFYNEPYIAAPMLHLVGGDPPHVEYAWRLDGSWHTIAARGEGEGEVPAPGSLEEFITEHYWGYTRQRDGGTLEYRVEHPRWKVWRARLTTNPGRLDLLYGGDFAEAMREPASVFIADGSVITVFRGQRVSTH